MAVLIHRPPEIMALTLNGEEHLIQMPLIPWLGTSALQLIGIVLPKLPTPLTDGFMGHGNATLEEEFL